MNLQHLNLKYAFVNASYMMLLSASMGFAYNYLTQSGFADLTVGIATSMVSLIGILVGPVVADVVDRSERLTLHTFIDGAMIAAGVFAAMLFVIPKGSFLIIPITIVSFTCATVGTPLINNMAFVYQKVGGTINYGFGRGMGSIAIAVGSNMIGRLWAGLGRNTMPMWMVFATALTLLAMRFMPKIPKRHDGKAASSSHQSISILQFFGKYRQVMVVVISVCLMFFCHFLVQRFMAKILGTFVFEDIERIQGNALFIQAMAELPTMFGFTLLMRRFGVHKILAVASVFLSIRNALVLVCNGVPMFYAAMAMQMLGYAAIIPGIVYFANEQVDEVDKNKGQAICSISIPMGTLLASFFGGWMFQYLDVRMAVAIGVVSSIVGTILMIVGTRHLDGATHAPARQR